MLRTTSILERLAALLVGGTPLFAQSRSTRLVAARFPEHLQLPGCSEASTKLFVQIRMAGTPGAIRNFPLSGFQHVTSRLSMSDDAKISVRCSFSVTTPSRIMTGSLPPYPGMVRPLHFQAGVAADARLAEASNSTAAPNNDRLSFGIPVSTPRHRRGSSPLCTRHMDEADTPCAFDFARFRRFW